MHLIVMRLQKGFYNAKLFEIDMRNLKNSCFGKGIDIAKIFDLREIINSVGFVFPLKIKM